MESSGNRVPLQVIQVGKNWDFSKQLSRKPDSNTRNFFITIILSYFLVSRFDLYYKLISEGVLHFINCVLYFLKIRPLNIEKKEITEKDLNYNKKRNTIYREKSSEWVLVI